MRGFRFAWIAGLATAWLAGCAAHPPRSQMKIAVADQAREQHRAYLCAQSCEDAHPSGSGNLFECVRRCPGVVVTEGGACDGASAYHAICYGNRPGPQGIAPQDRDNAARLAIGLLRGLSDSQVIASTVPAQSP